MLFLYKGSLVTNQKKCHFSAVSLHSCLPFGFVIIRMRSWESWNSRIMCIKKQRFAHRPQTSEENRCSIVLLRRQSGYTFGTIDILSYTKSTNKLPLKSGCPKTTKMTKSFIKVRLSVHTRLNHFLKRHYTRTIRILFGPGFGGPIINYEQNYEYAIW